MDRISLGVPKDAPTLRYLVYCRAFALGSLAHLSLPDAHERAWWPANAIYLAGILWLTINGHVFGWALAAIGLSWPLLALEDQLTQSLYLLLCAICGVLMHFGPRDQLAQRRERGLLAFVRYATVTVYAMAAVHKLNAGFFDASVSCAAAGAEVLARNWAMPILASRELIALYPAIFVAVEIAIAALLVWRPLLGVGLAAAAHIPLAIVFDPAYPFVMASGWICCFTERDLVFTWRTLRDRWPLVVAIGGGLGAASFALYMLGHDVVYPLWQLEEIALWCIVVLVLVLLWDARGRLALRTLGAWRDEIAAKPIAVGLAALFVLKTLTPYTGLWFHHSAAMLSNLRTDRGCWNHFLFPEAMRVRDPYVRLSRVELDPADPELASSFERRLFSPQALRRAAADVCASHAAQAELDYDGRVEHVDLCDVGVLPTVTLPGVRRYQENLEGQCPQACIH